MTHCLPWDCSSRKATCLQGSEWWETGTPASGRDWYSKWIGTVLFSVQSYSCYKVNSCHEDINQWMYWYTRVPGPSASTPMEGSRHSAATPHVMRKVLPSWSCIHCPFLAFHKPTHSLSHILLNASETLHVGWFLSQVYNSNPFPEMRAGQWVLTQCEWLSRSQHWTRGLFWLKKTTVFTLKN